MNIILFIAALSSLTYWKMKGSNMFRNVMITLSLLAVASTASAHFVFVVPNKGNQSAKVILSEDLQPDDEVPISIIAGTKLVFTDDAGHDAALKLGKSDHAFTIDLDASKPGVIYGVTDLGVTKLGGKKPCLLSYYPKTILGDPFDPKTRLGNQTPTELVPVGGPGKLKLLFLFAGKPVPNTEVDIILPDGTDQKVTTDKDGDTPAFAAPGRYGAWARHVEATAGEQNEKHYDEIRQYATLVIDAPAAVDAHAFPPLPQPASSFGAVACNGWLYIYGGHIARTHSYSTQSVSGEFHRLNLADPKAWESLPGGPPLQGMNLATWHGKIYRIGGMQPRNPPGKPADVRSVADCACFDPATNKWTALPPLPQPRSSHDVAVVGNNLFVVGGWDLTGDPDDAHWFDTALALDLSAAKPSWQSIKQPVQRRAFIAASFQDKVWFIGGFDSDDDPSREIDVYDPAAKTWSKGPALPAPDSNGFGAAACVLDGHLYVSVANGGLYRLDSHGSGWEKIAQTTPRIVHRLIPAKSQLLVIGGAAKKKQLDLIEAVTVGAAPAQSVGHAADAGSPSATAATLPAPPSQAMGK